MNDREFFSKGTKGAGRGKGEGRAEKREQKKHTAPEGHSLALQLLVWIETRW
jgi:hypothetical protein